MLCITRHEKMTYVTLPGLDDVRVVDFCWTPRYRIVLSWDLLSWISNCRVPCSFTDFITTPELSGPLYISPDIYHTRITEYSLETIYLHNYFQWALSLSIERLSNCYSVRPSPYSVSPQHYFLSPDWSFREHLSRATPTEMILYLLGSIRSEFLTSIRDCSVELLLDILEIIVKWLQVSISASECNRKPSD